jgi:hypothetical protein
MTLPSQPWVVAALGWDNAGALDGALCALDGRGTPVEEILICSASEGHVAGVSAGRLALERIWKSHPYARARIVFNGCASVAAAIAHASSGAARGAIILCDESSSPLSQRCLDIAGIGRGAVDDGLVALGGFGVLALSRCAPRPGDVRIRAARIFAKSWGMGGTQGLLGVLEDQYRRWDEAGVRPVSFEIAARWSAALFSHLAPGRSHAWLPSAESDTRHLMALKPLVELQTYLDEVAKTSIGLVTLGLGGRVGIIEASTAESPVSARPTPPAFVDRGPIGLGAHCPGGRPSDMVALDVLDPQFTGVPDLSFVQDLVEIPLVAEPLPASLVAAAIEAGSPEPVQERLRAW